MTLEASTPELNSHRLYLEELDKTKIVHIIKYTIYLIEKKSSGWKIILKHEITSYWSVLYSSCKTNEIDLRLCTDKAVQYFKPSEYGREQPYVFQIYHMGASGSRWEILTIVYDWYDKKFTKSSDNMSFPVIPNPPID